MIETHEEQITRLNGEVRHWKANHSDKELLQDAIAVLRTITATYPILENLMSAKLKYAMEEL